MGRAEHLEKASLEGGQEWSPELRVCSFISWAGEWNQEAEVVWVRVWVRILVSSLVNVCKPQFPHL